jgi:hypothetical protein
MAKLKVEIRYATIPNNILNSKDISFRAKGIWAYIYSKPDGWNFSIKNIATQSKEGVEAVRNAIKELETAHLLKRTKFQNELGYWDIEYLLLEVKSGKPDDGKPDAGKPYNGKDTNNSNKELSNKDIVKKKENTITSNEVSQIIEYFNFLFSTKFRETSERSKKIKLRLKTYSLDEIKKAIYNLSKSKFHNGDNDRNWRATIDFIIRNDEKIDEFLNSSPAKTEDIIITKKPYFMGKPLSKDMKYVIWSKGDIREFAGDKKDIIWK